MELNLMKSYQIWWNLIKNLMTYDEKCIEIWSNLIKSDQIWSNLIKSDQFSKYTHFGRVFGGRKKQPFLSVCSTHGVYLDHTPGHPGSPTGGGYAHG